MYATVAFVDMAETGEVYFDHRGEFIASPIKYADDIDDA